MSIALVTNYLPPYRVPLYRMLAERYGVEVYCFGGDARYVPEALRDLDRQLAAAPFPAHRLQRQRDAGALAAGHDAVIAALTGRVAVPAAWRGARRADRPFILWASMWRHPMTLAHQASFPMLLRIYRRADAIVAYGPHVERYLARHRRRSNVFVAPQTVEPDLFGRAVDPRETAIWRESAGVPADAPLALFVGRVEREKGVDVLIRAWRRLDHPDALLCVVGDGPLLEKVRAHAPPSVRFTGRVERSRLPAAYAAASFVVVPSIVTRRFLEPWGLVCNEAMMQGRPVIASAAVGAVPGGLVHHGATGMVVRPGDAAELATAMGILLEDHALVERMRPVARAAAAELTYERAADAFGDALAAAGVR